MKYFNYIWFNIKKTGFFKSLIIDKDRLFSERLQILKSQIDEYDKVYLLTSDKIIKSQKAFISKETETKLSFLLNEHALKKINALVRVYSFLSYPKANAIYSAKETEAIFNHYKIIYGDQTEFMDLVLNKFRESKRLGDYIYEQFMNPVIDELEKSYSKIAINYLVVDEAQEFHVFLASLNNDDELKNKLVSEILERNENLLQFYQNEETYLKKIVEIVISNNGQKYVL